jgi:non-canonical purine NTP pyrophosphatase (RdgB/HAM1 family)
MKTIVLASNNKNKVKEIKDILNNYNILSLNDIGYYDDIVEDGETFLDNAIIKARTISKFLRENNKDYSVIADDSGLCVKSLNNEPGVYSARYAGNHNDQANRDKVRSELRKFNDKSAYFHCSIVLYNSDDTYKEFVGITNGVIIDEERGSKDFGYDCIFLSDDLGKTFGEATEEEKNKVSHRGRAVIKLKEFLDGIN